MADITPIIVQLVELYGRDHWPQYILDRYDEWVKYKGEPTDGKA